MPVVPLCDRTGGQRIVSQMCERMRFTDSLADDQICWHANRASDSHAWESQGDPSNSTHPAPVQCMLLHPHALTPLCLQLLDECDKQDEMETAAVRLREMMQQETKEGNLAPEIDYTAANLHKKPTVRQRQALQGLRNLLVCVSSEAARYGPERCETHTPALAVLACGC